MSISIIVPIYFYNIYVEMMFKSILIQKNVNFEIIVVGNNISIEEFNEIKIKVLKLNLKYNINFKFIHTNKPGANFSRQLGFQNSSYEYVFFIDSDDQLENRLILSKVEKIITELKPDIISVNIQNCLLSDNQVVRKDIIYNFKLDNELLFLGPNSKQIIKDYGTNICGRFIRRELLEGITFLDLPYCQDWNVSSKLFCRLNTFYFISEPFYLYVHRSDSISKINSMSIRNHLNSFNSIEDIISFFKTNSSNDTHQYFLVDRIIKFCFMYIARSSEFDINEGLDRTHSLIKKEVKFNSFFLTNSLIVKMYIIIRIKFLFKIYLKLKSKL